MFELLDFYADWCGPCQMMIPVFAEVEKEMTGKLKFRRVNIDSEMEEAEKFGVMSVPTFVLTKEGQEIDRKVGAMPKEVLSNWILSKINF
jgi:thioredoxin 1